MNKSTRVSVLLALSTSLGICGTNVSADDAAARAYSPATRPPIESFTKDSIPVLSRKKREERNFQETVRRIERWRNLSLDANAFLSHLVQGLDRLQNVLRAAEAGVDAEWLRATSAVRLRQAEGGVVISASGGSATIPLDKSVPRLATDLVSKSERLVSAEDRAVVRKLLWFLCVDSCLEVINSPFSHYIYADSVAVERVVSRGKSFVPGVLPEVNADAVLVKRVLDPTLAPHGVIPGTRLLSLNGRSLLGQSLEELIDWWFQPAPFKYRLRIQSGSQEATVQSTAVPWRLESVVATCWRQLAYVRISFFSKDTLIELRRFLRTLDASPPRGMIIDLRSNAGGVRSFDVVDLFFKPGEIIGSFKQLPATNTETVSATVEYYGFRLALLLGPETASMAEAFAAAVKTNRRGLLIGERTFGKGVGQACFPVFDEGQLCLVDTLYFYPGTSEVWNEKGVEPDLAVQVSEESKQEIAEKLDLPVLNLENQLIFDPVLAKAVEVLTKEQQ